MNMALSLCAAAMLCCVSIDIFSESVCIVHTPVEEIHLYRPNLEEMQQAAPAAKAIFIEAFSATYTEYHRQSNSLETIETWLGLRPELDLSSWLNLVFEEEYEQCLAGAKSFVFLYDASGVLVGWLSHSPILENGDVYLSQCSLEAGHRNRKVATMAFEYLFHGNHVQQLFAGAKELKFITRKINTIAQHLCAKAGFVRDETMDPSAYGDSYDDRYIGFRFIVR